MTGQRSLADTYANEDLSAVTYGAVALRVSFTVVVFIRVLTSLGIEFHDYRSQWMILA